MNKTQTPEGYIRNAQGNLVPLENVKPLDKLRDELVRSIHDEAVTRAAVMRAFKGDCHKRIEEFAGLAAQEYNAPIGGEKGNITLHSYDGEIRVIRAKSDRIVFNEQIAVGRQKILACVKRWAEGANAHMITIANHAFKTDKNGHLSESKIISLFQYDIADEEWNEAIKAIKDSMQVVDTKTYLRIYRKDALGKYVQLALDGEEA
jgi:hypothetical protein